MMDLDLENLPVADRVRRALRDIEQDNWSTEALWLSAAWDWVQELGLLPPTGSPPPDVELAFYARLCEEGHDDPYYRYNAMRRELDSFLNAAQGRRNRLDSVG